MKDVTVLGGTGFLGRRVVEALADRGHDVRLGTRQPDGEKAQRLANRLQGEPGQELPGQVRLVRADVLEPATLAAAVAGADAVVNAVGHYVERGAATFEAVHVEGARQVAMAARDAGVQRLVQLSGIGADPHARSPYVQSRGRGEVAVRSAFPGATIVRPSAMFGASNGLVATLLSLVRRSPVIPLFGQGRTRLQPVFVGDVAAAIARMLEAPWTAGRVLELGGPNVVSYRTLLERVMRAAGYHRLLLPVPFAIWDVLAMVAGLLPSPPLTEGQVALMRRNNVAATDLPGLESLGIRPTAIETVLRQRTG